MLPDRSGACVRAASVREQDQALWEAVEPNTGL